VSHESNVNQALKTNTLFSMLLKGFRKVSYLINALKLRLQVKKMGAHCKVLSGVMISGGKNISIGENCFIGRDVLLDATQGDIVMGDGTEIRDKTRIYSRNVKLGSKITLAEDVFLKGRITLEEGAWVSRGCDLSGEVYIEKAILGPYVCCVGNFGHQRDPKTKQVLMSGKNLIDEGTDERTGRIRIGDGAWIGTRAIVLKGVTISPRTVVGAGSVVTKTYPDGAVIAGVPACEIKSKLTVN